MLKHVNIHFNSSLKQDIIHREELTEVSIHVLFSITQKSFPWTWCTTRNNIHQATSFSWHLAAYHAKNLKENVCISTLHKNYKTYNQTCQVSLSPRTADMLGSAPTAVWNQSTDHLHLQSRESTKFRAPTFGWASVVMHISSFWYLVEWI